MDAGSEGHDEARRRGRLAGGEERALRGYAPLAVATVALLAVIVVFPSRAPERARTVRARPGTESQTASGWGTTVEACPGGGPQVEGDPYSPPCFAFAGDNGGATSKGVTGEEITVSYRVTADPNVLSVLALLMGIEFNETGEDFQRTTEGLVEYFNETFQLYGRRIVLEPFPGKGSLIEELVGGGRENATNDGLKAGDELEAFADLTAETQPYAEALARQGTITFGAPYMSREWFAARRPYAWSLATDCSTVAEAGTTYALKRLIGQPAAFAGGELQGRTRKIAVIAPNNPEYQQCAASGLQVVEDAGEEIDFVTDYVLDLGRIPHQAKSISAQLVSKGITTITCFCDPFMLLNLTQEIEGQGLEPEWVLTGTAFVDLDLIGQGLIKKNDQWLRAFGLSPLADPSPPDESPGYRAFTSVRPDEEPSQAVDLLYYELYQLALGIQMAGPDLTPVHLETGLFSYPEATGPAGTWDYFPGSYTPITDLREVWWDPDRTSPFNGDPGSYNSSDERFQPADLDEGQPEVFTGE